MIHVIEGDGNGKTSSAVGLAVRAAGHGFRVLFVQFLKDDSSGEVSALKKIPEITTLHAPVDYGFSFQMTEEQKRETADNYSRMLEIVSASDAFLIVLDEVIHALNAGLVREEQLREILDKQAEIVLTGQNTPSWIIQKADYVSDIHKIKHPFDQGITARIGIEF